jgi:L-amino acid N-acyltransferase YncA
VKRVSDGSAWRVSDSTDAAVGAITEIYAYWVRHGLASFELVAPSHAQIAQRRAAILADRFPYLIATDAAGSVCGFAYAAWYRTRPGYRFACEDSVYVAPAALGRGAGRRLLEAVIARCTALQMRLMVAVIGDSNNEASITLHRRAGFERAGVLPAIGWKHERWVDTVLMTRVLGAGSSRAPVEHGRLLGEG